MANWTFDPSMYEEKEFALIPEGNHRVRIASVTEKTFRSGNDGYEITLDVSGYNARLWFYLVLSADDVKATNQRIGSFFDSFGIQERQLGNGQQWIGKVGAVRVKHEDYNGEKSAKAAFCISKARQDKLPAWKEPSNGGGSVGAQTVQHSNDPFGGVVINDNDLPFM